jgi:hypothetical protein
MGIYLGRFLVSQLPPSLAVLMPFASVALGEIRRNPPVMLEDWPEPEDELDIGDEYEFLDGEPIDEGIDGLDRDPPFVERQDPLRFHPDDEPELPNEALRAWMDLNLGDLADEEWIDLCK